MSPQMRKRATSNKNLFLVMSQILQEFSFILMQIYQQSDYTTMKSSMCSFKKCKNIKFEKLLLVARFLICGHIYVLHTYYIMYVHLYTCIHAYMHILYINTYIPACHTLSIIESRRPLR